MKRGLVITAALLFFFRPGIAQSSKPTYNELYTAVWQTINDNFYDPAFGGVNWDAVRKNIFRSFQGSMMMRRLFD